MCSFFKSMPFKKKKQLLRGRFCLPMLRTQKKEFRLDPAASASSDLYFSEFFFTDYLFFRNVRIDVSGEAFSSFYSILIRIGSFEITDFFLSGFRLRYSIRLSDCFVHWSVLMQTFTFFSEDLFCVPLRDFLHSPKETAINIRAIPLSYVCTSVFLLSSGTSLCTFNIAEHKCNYRL